MNPAPTPALRRLILGSALLLGLVAGLPWKTADVLAQTPAAPSAPVAPVAPTPPSPPAMPAAAPVSPPSLDQSPATKTKGDHGITARIEIDTTDEPAAKGDTVKDKSGVQHGVVIEKGGKKVRVVGLGDDREFDSIEEFAHKAPAVAGTVVGIVAIVFLSPALIVALFIWYRIRKARMLNETLLRLAERGIVPPAEAMQALGAGELPASVANAAHGPWRTPGRQGTRHPDAGSMVRPAQGNPRGRGRTRADAVFDARRRHAQFDRTHSAVRRRRLLRALVVRGAAQYAANRWQRLDRHRHVNRARRNLDGR